MKIYGYADEGLPVKDANPSELVEITLVATSKELRSIAAFLLLSANQMEEMKGSFEHLHLADKKPEFRGSPHFIVFSSERGSVGT